MKSLRSAILDELDQAIAVALATEREPNETLHTIRRNCKRIRAYLDLLSRVACKQSRKARTLVRNAAFSLAPFRDAHIIQQTFKSISKRYAHQVNPSAIVELAEQLRNQGDLDGNSVSILEKALVDSARALQRARRVVAKIRHRMTKRETRAAVVDGYRLSRKAAWEALRSSDPEVFHRLRKATKRHLYQCQYLARGRGRRFAVRPQAVLPLTDLLGESQDIAVLRLALSRIQKQSNECVGTKQSMAGCERSMRRLHTQALQLASQLFFASPKRFARELRK